MSRIRYMIPARMGAFLALILLVTLITGCSPTSFFKRTDHDIAPAGKQDSGTEGTASRVPADSGQENITAETPSSSPFARETGQVRETTSPPTHDLEARTTSRAHPFAASSQDRPTPAEELASTIEKKADKKTTTSTSSTDSSPLPEGVAHTDQGLVLNFDHADLTDVVMAMAEILGLNYMVMADLKGQVTIQTSGFLNKNDLLPLFYQILEANGLTAVKENNLYKIVETKEAPRLITHVRTDPASTIPAADRSVQIQIIPLKHISPQEMTTILTPFISNDGSIISHEKSRTLLLIDQRMNIVKAMQLIDTFDIDLFDQIKYRFFPIQHQESKEILKSLNQIISVYNQRIEAQIQIIDLEKLNSILVLTTSERLLDTAEKFIKGIDTPGLDSEPHIYIYFIKNSQASEMASLLNSIFSASSSEKTVGRANAEKDESGAAEQNPFSQKTPPPPPVKTVSAAPLADFGSGTLRGEIKITEDEIRNALVIEAIPSDYRIVEKVLKRLDILPRQVLISVMIAEVKLEDGLDLGVEWTWYTENGQDIDTPSFWSASTGADGLFYAIGQANKWNAALSALAQKSLVNIVSSPSVLASDNKKAQINISTEVPVASAQIQYDNTVSDKTQTDIQYRNTGVILNVTPHINEFGLVSMDINQEVSEVAGNVSVGESTYPSFFKRSVTTSLTVNDGQTIVIGGLIRETKSDDNIGVPFLADIPLIGWLFGTVSDSLSKSELIILITPRVVANLDDVNAVTAEFSKKVGYDLKNQKM